MADGISGMGMNSIAGDVWSRLASSPAARQARAAKTPAEKIAGAIDPATKGRAVQAAKDFESVLLHKLLSEMRETIPDSGLLSDGTSKQMEGIFWMYLSRHMADQGGLGLWKDIYRQSVGPDQAAENTPTVEQLL